MTPSQLEHLRLIDAHLDKLLDIAAKRTPGEWQAFQRDSEIGTNYCRVTFTDRASDSLRGYCGENNATFIASCAGNAEAGWINTKNEINELLSLLNPVPSGGYTVLHSYAQNRAASILSAWPIELITP